jgi:RNA polymerase sigma-70 factor (ECF subfamily)
MASRVYAQQPVAAASFDPPRSDEELMLDLANGQQDALGPLYGRYASLVFQLCAHSLDRAAAEELVQEVFLTIWRGANTFDASQGAFRPWLLRLTHWKILNELRRRRRRPSTADDDDDPLDEMADREPGPEERAWQTEHEHIVKSALAALPPKQRQAIALAFLEDMTHEQVARTLDVPLGTAKTRIRSGLQILRTHLAPLAASLLGLGLAVVGFRDVQTQLTLDRDTRAIAMVTTSEVTPLRLTPAAGAAVPSGAHANYRSRSGVDVAVLSTEFLPSAPAGETYQAWARHDGTWTSLGTFTVGGDGTAQVVAEDPALRTAPDAVEVTLEQLGGSQTPGANVVLAWAP